jgi:hypothetical protein
MLIYTSGLLYRCITAYMNAVSMNYLEPREMPDVARTEYESQSFNGMLALPG